MTLNELRAALDRLVADAPHRGELPATVSVRRSDDGDTWDEQRAIVRLVETEMIVDGAAVPCIELSPYG